MPNLQLAANVLFEAILGSSFNMAEHLDNHEHRYDGKCAVYGHCGKFMKQFGGWRFPDGEEHLIDNMGKSPRHVAGRLSYQFHKLEMAIAYVGEFRHAVDVGGHVGLWSWHLAPRFDRVDAFEPLPAHRECFVENVTADNVTLWSCALAAEEGSVRMTTYHGNSGHSHVSAGGEMLVPTRTLDSFNFLDVDFLKIDTEGYELEVLKGAVETLKRCKPVIIVEQKRNNGSRYGHDDRAALPFLEKLGARRVAEKAGDYVFVWR